MSDSEDYTAWFGQELKKLIDLVASRTFNSDPNKVRAQIAEISRGVEYGINYPGSIDELVLKLGRNLVDSLEVYLRQMQPRTPAGIPPGGHPTLLSGGGGVGSEQTRESPPSSTSQFSVDELKGALESRKKKAVESKMKGSLDLLKEYEED